MPEERTELPATDAARIAEMRVSDLLFELLRAEKYVNGDDSMSVLSVFVPSLYEAGYDARHVDIYVEYADVAEIVDVRRTLAQSAWLTRAIEENFAHLDVIEEKLGKKARLTLVCVTCDAARKRELLEQHERLRVIDAAELVTRMERLGLMVPANWTEGAQLLGLTDALRRLSQRSMGNGSSASG